MIKLGLKKASKVIATYLRFLAKNKYTINDTFSFPEMLKNDPFDKNYEDGSYDVESLCTRLEDTIDYI